MVGWRGFEVSGNGAMMGLVQDFFTTEAQRAQRFLWWEGADSRSVGMALCRGWYRFFFTTEAQRAQRFFVVGRRRLERGESGGNGALSGVVGGFFTTKAQRAQRFFMVGWRGFEVSGNCAMMGLVQELFTTEAQRAQRFFRVRARRFEGSGNGTLSGVEGAFFHHRGHSHTSKHANSVGATLGSPAAYHALCPLCLCSE